MTSYNDFGSKGGVRLPGITDTAIETTVELLALADFVFQSTGTLKVASGAQDFAVGHVMAIESASGKYVPYVQGGSGGEEVAVGFLRIAVKTEAAGDDAAVEVVIGGAVKNALVLAASNWNAGVLTDLGARANTVADALIF